MEILRDREKGRWWQGQDEKVLGAGAVASWVDFLAEIARGCPAERCHGWPAPLLAPQLSDRHGPEEQQDRQLARERDLQLHEGALPLLQSKVPGLGWRVGARRGHSHDCPCFFFF